MIEVAKFAGKTILVLGILSIYKNHGGELFILIFSVVFIRTVYSEVQQNNQSKTNILLSSVWGGFFVAMLVLLAAQVIMGIVGGIMCFTTNPELCSTADGLIDAVPGFKIVW
jgi:hypothetical protein